MKSLKKTLVLLVVFSMILSTLVPAFAFSDVEAGAVYEDQVTRMAALGIINGYAEDGTFKPDETVTRAQMVKIIGMMLGLDEGDAKGNQASTSKFSDVSADHWANGWINIASNKGIVNGYPDGTFRPDASLTLNEVLTLCVKALGRGGYVDKMGAWPGNYLTEAARLNLKKDVEAHTVADRGTVAVIAWNTLNAATWYVKNEDLEGKVSLGHDDKSLLAINFAEFATEAGELKEITVDPTEYSVTFDDNFIEIPQGAFADLLNYDYNNVKDMFDLRTKKSDEKTYFADNKVYAYVPEEVMEDVEVLKNKEFTLIFGKDNEVISISIEDDVVATAFLTEYEDNKVVVDGETYKLADEYTVTVNDVVEYVCAEATEDSVGEVYALNATIADGTKYYEKGANDSYTQKTASGSVNVDAENKYYKFVAATPAQDALTLALNAIGITDFDDIEKKIEATLTLNSKDKVEDIELFVSMTDADIHTTEALVLEVKEGKDKYTIYLAGDEKIVVEDDFEEFPKVYVDGAKGELSDIKAGNVLTIITDNSSDTEVKFDGAEIAKIYVSTETKTGEPNRVKKSNEAIEVDGTEYLRSVALSEIYIEDLEDDAETVPFAAETIMDNAEVTLYLNIFGEYVGVYVEDGVGSDYQFGVVTYVDRDVDYEGDDGEIETMTIKLLAQDATKSVRYTVKADTSDDDIDEGDIDNLLGIENKLVMFVADADRNINYEDLHVISTAAAGEAIEDLEDYTFFNTTTVDGKKVQKAVNDLYRYSASKTVIFNIGKDAELYEAADNNKYEKCEASDKGALKVVADAASPFDATKEVKLATVNAVDAQASTVTEDFEINDYARLVATGDVKVPAIDTEIVSDWSAILDTATTLQNQAICVLDKDEDLVCIALLVDSDGSSDTEYAVVAEEIYRYDDEYYAKLLVENETLTFKADKDDDAKILLGGFVSYNAPSDKIKNPVLLLDVVAFNKSLEDNNAALATGTDGNEVSTILPTIAADLIINDTTDYFAWAENFEVANIYFDDDADNEYEIEYVEISNPEDKQIEELTSIDLAEKNTTVYDLRDGKCVEMTMKSLKALVDADAEVYVIRVAGTDSAADEDILVVLGEIE